MRRHTVPRLRPWLPWTLLAITQTWNRTWLELLAQLWRDSWVQEIDQGGAPSSPLPVTRCPLTWSSGPTDTLRTLLDTCSQLEPCG